MAWVETPGPGGGCRERPAFRTTPTGVQARSDWGDAHDGRIQGQRCGGAARHVVTEPVDRAAGTGLEP